MCLKRGGVWLLTTAEQCDGAATVPASQCTTPMIGRPPGASKRREQVHSRFISGGLSFVAVMKVAQSAHRCCGDCNIDNADDVQKKLGPAIARSSVRDRQWLQPRLFEGRAFVMPSEVSFGLRALRLRSEFQHGGSFTVEFPPQLPRESPALGSAATLRDRAPFPIVPQRRWRHRSQSY